MATISVRQAIQDINNHITKCGSSYGNWYAGVAKNPKDRLFTDHSVDEKCGAWIFCSLNTDAEARQVEKYFLQKGCKGGTGGGGNGTRYCYAYKVTGSTRQ